MKIQRKNPLAYRHLYRGAVCPDFIFMDDNASPLHTALFDGFLQSEDIQHMQWPANSSDLNPIEHVWEMLGRDIAALHHLPSSVLELKSTLRQAWNSLSRQLINSLVESIGNR